MGFKNFADLEIGDIVYEFSYHKGEIEKRTIEITKDNLIIYRHINIERDYCCGTSSYYGYNWVGNVLESTEKQGLNLPIWFNKKYNILYTTIPDIGFVINGLFEWGKDDLRREIKKMLNIIDPQPNYGEVLFK